MHMLKRCFHERERERERNKIIYEGTVLYYIFWVMCSTILLNYYSRMHDDIYSFELFMLSIIIYGTIIIIASQNYLSIMMN